MKASFYFVIAFFLFIYGFINYYIGSRLWQLLFSPIPHVPAAVYWIVFWGWSLSYLLGRVGEKFLPARASAKLEVVGAYWLAFMYYALLVLLLFDGVRAFNKLVHVLPQTWFVSPVAGALIFVLVAGTVVYGAWNARHPEVRRYEVNIAKKAGELKSLHVVAVSDIHLGTIMHEPQLKQMVEMINALKPDVILFAGDVIDENVERVLEKEMEASFRRLTAPYGVYAVMGNHEYIGGHAEEAAKYLEGAAIQVLRDRWLKVADSFYVIGRDESSKARFTGERRLDLQEVLKGVDKSLPLILLDHVPSGLEEPEAQGIDLQFSGHTHRGQLFPNQWITGRIFEQDWGYLRKGNFQIIVSSGFGTWGPPIRVGNKPEIVDVTIRLGQQENSDFQRIYSQGF